MALPDWHTNPVVMINFMGDPIIPLTLQDPRQNFPVVCDRKANPRIADDSSYAFYRPQEGLIYPLIQ